MKKIKHTQVIPILCTFSVLLLSVWGNAAAFICLDLESRTVNSPQISPIPQKCQPSKVSCCLELISFSDSELDHPGEACTECLDLPFQPLNSAYISGQDTQPFPPLIENFLFSSISIALSDLPLQERLVPTNPAIPVVYPPEAIRSVILII